MPGAIYAALSGLRTRTERLDRIAGDIANAQTPGYKGDRTTTIAAERPRFSDSLAAAVDVISSKSKTDFRGGSVVPTGRDLDFAIQGEGFFSIQTPTGVRYSRNGHFTKSQDGSITTPEGDLVLGEDGSALKLPPGELVFGEDGTIRVGKTTVGRPAVTTFSDPSQLIRENGVRFMAPATLTPEPAANSTIKSGVLEESNVSPQERMAQLIGASRSFAALQRGVTILTTELDSRAISELGRR